NESFLDEFDKELNQFTRRLAAARYTERMFENAELRLENGERELAIIFSQGSKRLMSGTKAYN
ncbi:hypothetical protein BGZ89_005306, partial [Linnemannia elongata]